MLSLCSVLCVGGFGTYISGASKTDIRPIADVDPSTLAESGNVTGIKSFDISSDGNRISLLYRTGKSKDGYPVNPEMWAAVWDVPSKKIIGQTKLGEENVIVRPTHSSDPKGPVFDENFIFKLKFRSHIEWSPDQGHLIAMSLGNVWVLDGTNCTIIHSINPPQIEKIAPVDVQALSNSTLSIAFQYGLPQFEVDFYDLATGNKLRTWRSSTFPDSYSPDGKLAVAPDPAIRNKGGVTNVQVVDASTGEKLKSFPVPFRFRRSMLGFGPLAASGSVISRFLTNEQIVVAPDDSYDVGGNPSSRRLEIIDIQKGRIVREINPKKYGPSGVLLESADRGHFAIQSIYAAPFWYSDYSDPKHFTATLMLFANSGATPEVIFPYPALIDVDVPPRISSDASVVALLVDNHVQLFRMK